MPDVDPIFYAGRIGLLLMSGYTSCDIQLVFDRYCSLSYNVVHSKSTILKRTLTLPRSGHATDGDLLVEHWMEKLKKGIILASLLSAQSQAHPRHSCLYLTDETDSGWVNVSMRVKYCLCCSFTVQSTYEGHVEPVI